MRAITTTGFVFGLLLSASSIAAPCDGFVDVDDGNAEFCTAVTFVKNKGITLGCTDSSHYCPNANVTRLQMALFLQRMGKGGPNNTLGDSTTTIGGGIDNSVVFSYSTVGGGVFNTASGNGSVVGGGSHNTATGIGSVVGGGGYNIASGAASTIPGGNFNTAFGAESFAAGQSANANYDGCFVWGDGSTSNEVRCDEENRFVVRATHGIFMFTAGSDQTTYTGAVLPHGATAWIAQSDRASKDHVEAVDTAAVLRKVAALPIATWNYKSQGPSIRHIGPMAQDFHAAFGLGETPKGISTIDADGVALAAIQGLYAELRGRDAAIESLRGELAVLRSALEELRKNPSSAAVASKW